MCVIPCACRWIKLSLWQDKNRIISNIVKILWFSLPTIAENMVVKMPAMQMWNWHLIWIPLPPGRFLYLLDYYGFVIWYLMKKKKRKRFSLSQEYFGNLEHFARTGIPLSTQLYVYSLGFISPPCFETGMFCLKHWYGLASHDDQDCFALFHCHLLHLIEFCASTECMA